MFANTFQSGFISIFYSVGSNPLSLWDKQVKNGHIRRVIDDEVKSLVLEVSGTNVATTYITSPIKPRASLAIRLPFLVMIVKNMKKYFTFEIQILDDKDMHRRFRVSNFQSTTKVRPFCTTMPIGLSSGWNQIQFNLADFTRRAYGTMYIETMRVQIHANVRIRRIYFADRLYGEDEMPSEYKLFLPVAKDKELKKSKEALAQQGKVISKPSDHEIKEEAEVATPTGAPPTPVGTEAVTQDERATDEEIGKEHVDTEEISGAYEGEFVSTEDKTEEGLTEGESTKEPLSDIGASEEGPSEIATDEPTDTEQPSEAPTDIGTDEPLSGEAGTTEPLSEEQPSAEVPSSAEPTEDAPPSDAAPTVTETDTGEAEG